jgi:hypothetical protein
MEPIDEEEVLAAVRRDREVREMFEEALRELRPAADRNVAGAVVNFTAGAVMWGFGYAVAGSIEENSISQSQFPIHHLVVFQVLVPLLFLFNGIRHLRPRPRDRLLLFLAQEARGRFDAACAKGRLVESPPHVGEGD